MVSLMKQKESHTYNMKRKSNTYGGYIKILHHKKLHQALWF